MPKYKKVKNYSGDGYELVEHRDGTRYWYYKGLPHKEDGPAAEESDGSKYWYKKGLLHRENGPAIEEANGTKKWLINGLLHREDGPAVEEANGIKEWYINGKKLDIQWFLDNPLKIPKMKAWEILTPTEIVKIRKILECQYA